MIDRWGREYETPFFEQGKRACFVAGLLITLAPGFATDGETLTFLGDDLYKRKDPRHLSLKVMITKTLTRQRHSLLQYRCLLFDDALWILKHTQWAEKRNLNYTYVRCFFDECASSDCLNLQVKFFPVTTLITDAKCSRGIILTSLCRSIIHWSTK